MKRTGTQNARHPELSIILASMSRALAGDQRLIR
jgi:hypothetical protein